MTTPSPRQRMLAGLPSSTRTLDPDGVSTAVIEAGDGPRCCSTAASNAAERCGRRYSRSSPSVTVSSCLTFPGLEGVYANFISDEGAAGVEYAYGSERLKRLTALKDLHDADNFFCMNANIAPSSTAGADH